ncbi:MAG TPA: HAD-IC family P-type ATPase, partial [Candidatus Babeliales bacterium]|nr:HAD-IC family P-type ATPase [Candidatus Babeliales bacterium]
EIAFYANSSIEDVLKKLETSEKGLSQQQVKERLTQYGPNQLEKRSVTWFQVLKKQILNPFIVLFIVIAAVYFFTHEYTEATILLIIMVLNTIIGFYQEYQSNRAMELLKSYLKTQIVTHRDDTDDTIETMQLVPGDIIKLNAGDIVPADCRLLATENCTIDESMLTGESMPVKKLHELSDKKVSAVYNAYTLVYAGTVMMDGNATAVVFATGQKTEMGSIAELVTKTIVKSALTKGTTQLAEIVFALVAISLVIVLGVNIFFKSGKMSFVDFLLFAGALAITAIPSALPVVITFCLTKGAMTLRQHKMIVKRLSSIEDLGSIEIFCSDKTGTLTENALTVQDLYDIKDQDILVYAALMKSILASTKKNILSGFDQAVEKALDDTQKKALHEYSIIEEFPFTYERYHTVSLVQKNKEYFLISKGPSEYIFPLCKLSKHDITKLNTWVKKHEEQGNRVLALAVKKIEHAFKDEKVEKYDKDYDHIGLISFADPLKPTAEVAIKKAEALGVKIKILSGDSVDVCFAIAQQLGLEDNKENIVLGADFAKADERHKKSLADKHTIFARVTPQQKYEIITLLQEKYSVGYLGDGINDAPPLKSAQVGMAVNSAAGVAREAADIIMLEKSLHNVLLGIEEGRKTIINTLKYIKITISCNIALFYALVFSSLFIDFLPMLPLQLTFLDLITDFPLISISTDPVNNQELQKPLRYSMKEVGLATFFFGLVRLPFDFLVFMFFKSNPNHAVLQTSWFITTSLFQFVLIFSLRTKIFFLRKPYPSLTLSGLCLFATSIVLILPFTNLGHTLFSFARPSWHDMAIIFMI